MPKSGYCSACNPRSGAREFDASNFPSEIPHPAVEGFGDLGEGFKGDFLFGPLDIADIISCQIRLFGQFLLAQMQFSSFGVDFCPKGQIYFSRVRIHNPPIKSERRWCSTNQWLVFLFFYLEDRQANLRIKPDHFGHQINLMNALRIGKRANYEDN